MNSENIPNEEIKKDVLQRLRADYWNTKAAVEMMKAANQPEEVTRIELQADRIAEQIKLLDPDFNLEVKKKIADQFDKEAEHLNANQYEKPDYNQFN